MRGLGLGARQQLVALGRVVREPRRLDRPLQPHQRRAQIVRQALRGGTHAGHQRLVLVEHLVEGARQRPERVEPLAFRCTRLHLAAHDFARRLGDAGESRQQVAIELQADAETAGEHDQHRDHGSGRDRTPHLLVAQVALADEQAVAVAARARHHQHGLAVRRSEVIGCIAIEHPPGPVLQPTDRGVPLRVEQQQHARRVRDAQPAF